MSNQQLRQNRMKNVPFSILFQAHTVNTIFMLVEFQVQLHMMSYMHFSRKQRLSSIDRARSRVIESN